MSPKQEAVRLFEKALHAVMPSFLIPSVVHYHDDLLTIENQTFDLRQYRHVSIFGSGKAAIEMAKALQKVMGSRIHKNMVVSNYHEAVSGIEVIESTHPLPSKKSIAAAQKLITSFEEMQENDFFIYLLSGGSSALIEQPVAGVSLEDFIETTKVLLHSGLSIEEINVIRKSLSQIKGGGLAGKTRAKGVVLVVSDVIGDDLQAIGSAPLLESTSSKEDASKIIDRYNILALLPKSVQTVFKEKKEQLDKKRAVFPHFLIASNYLALQEAQKEASRMGLQAKIVSHTLDGDVKEVAQKIIDAAHETSNYNVLLFGGEPTVEVKGSGKGGRNQELCLWVLKGMQKETKFTFLSAGSDGIDGNSDAAGAVVSVENYHDSIDGYLENNDSYHYLKAQDALIITGESGTNVMDIMIAIECTERTHSFTKAAP